MTTEVQTPEKVYDGDGISVSFAAPFRFLTGTLVVDVISAAAVVSRLMEGSDYAVSGGDTDQGGTVTLVSGALAPIGSKLRIRRNTPRKQTADYDTNDTFPAETHEGALDRLSLITQEQDVRMQDLEDRAALAPEGDTGFELPLTAERALRLPRYDAGGRLGLMEGRNVLVALDAQQRPFGTPVFEILRSIGTTIYDDGTWGGAFNGDDGVWG